MTTYQTRVLAAFLRVEEYFKQAGEDFFASPRNRELIPELSQIIQKLQELTPRQVKKTKLIPAVNDEAVMAAARDLRDELLKVTRSCRVLTDVAPELRTQFRMPRSPGLSALMKTARDFIRRTTPELKALFLDTELSPDYLEMIAGKLKGVEEVLGRRSSVRKSRTSATTEVAATFARGMTILRKLDVAVRNKLTDPEALEIWRIARNVELLHRPPSKRRFLASKPAAPTPASSSEVNPTRKGQAPVDAEPGAKMEATRDSNDGSPTQGNLEESEDESLLIEEDQEWEEELSESELESPEPAPEETAGLQRGEPVEFPEPLEPAQAANAPAHSNEVAAVISEEQPSPKPAKKRSRPAADDMQGDLFGGLNS